VRIHALLRRLNRLLLLPFLLASPLMSSASTVLELEFSEVVQEAELVFEGRVLSVEAREDGRVIYTQVVFELLDIIKGSHDQQTIELHFLGGRIGNRELRVAEMHVPSVGETGVYFVESLSEALVHPLVGWDQGRFLIQQDAAGNRHMMSADATPVVGVELATQSGSLQTSPAVPEEEKGISKGVAKGVITQEMLNLSGAMSVRDFKNAVRELDAQAAR
jgi:hypothetical protein